VAAGTTFTLTGNYISGAHINYLIEGLDLLGTLIESDNSSGSPRLTDWESAEAGCGGIRWDQTIGLHITPRLQGGRIYPSTENVDIQTPLCAGRSYQKVGLGFIWPSCRFYFSEYNPSHKGASVHP
jgi:hypothetical protein